MEIPDWFSTKCLNKEKLNIISEDGNVLVTANPGTGKTLLLTYKYLGLLENGYKPEDILCLTFTTKAKTELENRVIKEIKDNNLNVDLSNLKVYTFHSFALDYLEDNNLISSNLLRYVIYSYLKEHEILNYSDDYLLDTIVPKFENLLRYLKNFGIKPKDIDKAKVKPLINSYKKQSKEELDFFLDYFVEIFEHYEKIKSARGIDYTDMLLNFLDLKELPKFKYVLVDELQDVNSIEAKIVLRCCENFVVVGDKKQAIFGFQGGSISNYELFKDSKKFILSHNFRSSQQILDYARNYFLTKSNNKEYCEELENLTGAQGEFPKPIIYNDNSIDGLCELINRILPTLEIKNGKQEQLGVIVRNNSQIQEISKALKLRDFDFSVTYFSASTKAKEELIVFLKGLLSDDINDIRKALLTIYSPCPLKESLIYTTLDLDNLFNVLPEFKKMRELTNINELNKLFDDYILRLAVPYGEEYLFACMSVKKSYNEALNVLDNLNYITLIKYLESADLVSQEIDSKKKIVVTTVHKSKGLQYKAVIYIPKEPKDHDNFQDYIVDTILKSKDFKVDEELFEEHLRIDFVALTRAEKELYVLPKRVEDYINEFAEQSELEISEQNVKSISELSKKAFNLFLLKDYENAKKLLETKDSWLREYIKNYFSNLERLSYSNLSVKPYDFFYNNILNIKYTSSAMEFGKNIHSIAEDYLNGKEIIVDESNKNQFENLKSFILEIKKDYPEFVFAEKKFVRTVKELFSIDSNIKFSGVFDAVFKNGNNYLIVDWKTDKTTENAFKHRQQLMIYKKALALELGIAEENIKVELGFLNLVPKINIGVCNKELDVRQPQDKTIETIANKVNTIINWKANPDLFIEEFISSTSKDDLTNPFYLALKEQLEKEME